MHAAEDPDIDLRPAEIVDLPELSRLESSSFIGDRISNKSFRRWLKANNNVILTQRSKKPPSRLLGYALVLFHYRGRVARIYSLAIDPDHRGRGLGYQLLAACLDEARRRGYSEVRLEVAATNDAAISLYQKLGFKVFDKRAGYYEDGSDALRLRTAV